jgi:hypothetical protein
LHCLILNPSAYRKTSKYINYKDLRLAIDIAVLMIKNTGTTCTIIPIHASVLIEIYFIDAIANLMNSLFNFKIGFQQL